MSRLVADYLRSLAPVGGEDEFQRLLRQEQEIIRSIDPRFSARENVPRDQLYDRALR